MGSKYTASQKEASMRYLSDKTDSIQIRVKKGSKDRYKEYASSCGKSLNALIIELLEKEIEQKQNATVE